MSLKFVATAVALTVSISSMALAENFVVGADTKKVHIYNGEYDEIAHISKSDFTKGFSELKIGEETQLGTPIIKFDEDEQMVQIAVSGFDKAVWVEQSQVKVWPKKMIKCPKATVAKSERDQRGGAIGFGAGICK